MKVRASGTLAIAPSSQHFLERSLSVRTAILMTTLISVLAWGFVISCVLLLPT
jgi:hypothetical protein